MVLSNKLSSWQKLQQQYDSEGKSLVMKDLFAKDPSRFEKFSRSFKGSSTSILLDFSKNRIDDSIFKSLISLAEEAKVAEMRHA
jgi:glucose-6-phosphate isomerase